MDRVPNYKTLSEVTNTPPQRTRATLPHLVYPPLLPLLLRAEDTRAWVESQAGLDSHGEGQVGQSDTHENGNNGPSIDSWATEDGAASASRIEESSSIKC